jgi:hypothetical protein
MFFSKKLKNYFNEEDVYAGILSWKIGGVKFVDLTQYYYQNFSLEWLEHFNSNSNQCLFFYQGK